jgi:hypothetical protein
MTRRGDKSETTAESLVLGNLAYTPESDGDLRVDLEGFGVSGRMWLDKPGQAALHRYLGGFVGEQSADDEPVNVKPSGKNRRRYKLVEVEQKVAP